MYIIYVSAISFVLLIFTAWIQYKSGKIDNENTTNHNKKVKQGKRQKTNFYRSEHLVHIFQEVIIVFFSAVLAIWLTQSVENYNNQRKVQSLLQASYFEKINQLSQVSGTFNDIVEDNLDEEYSIEDKVRAAESIIKSHNDFTENILSNETVLSQINSSSYVLLSICMENITLDVAYLEDEMKCAEVDYQIIAEYAASYCFYSYNMAFYFECLSDDVNFNLLQLAFVDEEFKESSASYKAYIGTLNNIEIIFNTELSEWKERDF